MSFQTLKVQELEQGTIVRVTISRPKALNAMNLAFFNQIGLAFRNINQMPNVRVAILQAEGKVFSAGLDLKEASSSSLFNTQEGDPARSAIKMYNSVKSMQKSFVDIFDCRVPVLVGIHSMCIGGGIDLSCTGDIRYCTKDAQFTIKEIDIGMAADLGTLQLFPKLVGNQSVFKELAYTGRYMKSDQALQIGFVSKIVEDKKELDKALLATASLIASKSPVGIYTIKQVLRKAERKHYIEGLQDIVRTNGAMLQTKDMTEAITSFLMKKKPEFPKL